MHTIEETGISFLAEHAIGLMRCSTHACFSLKCHGQITSGNYRPMNLGTSGDYSYISMSWMLAYNVVFNTQLFVHVIRTMVDVWAKF